MCSLFVVGPVCFILAQKVCAKLSFMFLHFVPVDGVEYFSGIFGQERYVFMFFMFP